MRLTAFPSCLVFMQSLPSWSLCSFFLALHHHHLGFQVSIFV
ncbi:hypothetical protein NC652_016675 [Populus alba x Populus x berolinensis]|nr:hypothetical protein NC652_016675 [Populus alba x Populus x berolinensis]